MCGITYFYAKREGEAGKLLAPCDMHWALKQPATGLNRIHHILVCSI